jgi:hypothetical protein
MIELFTWPANECRVCVAKCVTGSGSRLFRGGFLIAAVLADFVDGSFASAGFAADFLASSPFLTCAPESSDPEEMESVSLAMPSREDELR